MEPLSSLGAVPSRVARALGVAAWAAVLALGLLLGHHSQTDQDLPLHDATGRRLVAGDGLPRRNLHSFTAPDHPWVDHEWLFQAVVAAAGDLAAGRASGRLSAEGFAARAAGWHVVQLALVAGLVAALLGGDGGWRRLRGAGTASSAWLALPALAALAMLWTRLQLRPELASLVLFVLVLRQVEAAVGDPGTRAWRELADPRRPAGRAHALTWLWAQLHGFFVLAAVVWLAVGLTADRRARPGPGPRALALAGAAIALLAGFLTPNLVEGGLYPLRALGQFTRGGPDLQETISELVPLLRSPDGLHLTISVFLASLAWGAAWTIATWRRAPRGRIILWALAAVAAWQAQRNLGFYAVAFLLLHTGVRAGPRPFAGRVAAVGRRIPRSAPALAATAALAAAAIWGHALITDRFYLREGDARRWGAGLTPACFPARQAAALDGTRRIANNVDAASTLIALSAGPVCIDGRTEAYPAAAWTDYERLKEGGPAALALLERWGAGAVVLAHRNPASHALARTLFAADRWTLAGADDAGVLFLPGADPANAGGEIPADRLRREAAAFAGTLAARAGRDVRAADRCAAWAALANLAGQDDLARDLLERARRLCGDHPVVLHNLGNRMMAAGDLAGAAALFREAARLNPRAAGSLINAGVCAARLGRAREAVDLLSRATRLAPRRFEAWASLAEVSRASGDLATARRAYAKALALRDDPHLRARSRDLDP